MRVTGSFRGLANRKRKNARRDPLNRLSHLPGTIISFNLIPPCFQTKSLSTKSLSVTADEFGTMLMGEHDQIVAAFQEKIPLPIKLPEYGCLKSIAEIVSDTKDLALVMDLAAFVKEYPDIRYDQCVAILALRGDMSRDEIRTELANSGVTDPVTFPPSLSRTELANSGVTEEHGGGGTRRTIFSDVADVRFENNFKIFSPTKSGNTGPRLADNQSRDLNNDF
eukprot:sb/3469738/